MMRMSSSDKKKPLDNQRYTEQSVHCVVQRKISLLHLQFTAILAMLYFRSAGENNLLMLVAIIAIVSVLRPKHLNKQDLLPGRLIIEPANQQPEEELGHHVINCTYSSHSVGIKCRSIRRAQMTHREGKLFYLHVTFANHLCLLLWWKYLAIFEMRLAVFVIHCIFVSFTSATKCIN